MLPDNLVQALARAVTEAWTQGSGQASDQASDQATVQATVQAFLPRDVTPVSGGSINGAWRLSDGERSVFVKTNRGHQALPMFEAEAEGLVALARGAGGGEARLRVPTPLGHGVSGSHAWLVLEWITLQGRGDWAAMGRGLAAMHRTTAAAHGWHRDNTIGASPQRNTRGADWAVFFADQRLGHQLDLAEQGRGGAPGPASELIRDGRRLQRALPDLLAGHQPVASLLHGDLWSGNAAFDQAGRPVVYDPAVYFGDRETDLAMAECFGGFPAEFHQAYEAAWPLSAGYPRRRPLYQLYHVLNHGNLFGGGYWQQARTIIQDLLG